ncbi:MAG: carbohydrate binding domain-containing protein, partial [Pyrinomonadaceae bacterium MAG19_C2-C3]|nr:carbohydrate binding domain-containing protein [Pyrinomonadaceae bacterium MAG19_C2-C3]
MKTSNLVSTISIRLIALFCALSLISFNMQAAFAQVNTITVQVNRPGAKIAATQFGLFFEDINFAADGGIYPERVKNRSFEFPDPMMGWKKIEGDDAKGTVNVINQSPVNNANPRFLRITAEGDKGYGVTNEGFRGIGIQQNGEYTFSIHARRAAGAPSGLRIELEDADGRALGQTSVTGITPEWKQYTSSIRATATSGKANLRVLATGRGAIDVDLVSLYPKDTWKNRPNGLRSDLVQLLRDMKPGFLRFPGGCIVEGRTLNERYQWKTTI